VQNGKSLGAGVKVLFIGVDSLHPPKDTVMAFEQVVGAEQKYYARLKDAEGSAIETLTNAVGSVTLANQIVNELDKLSQMPGTKDGKPDPAVVEQRLKIRSMIETAGGKAAATLQEASADRWERHMGERARLSAYQGQLGAFRAAPEYYRASIYLDALRSALADARVYVADGAGRVRVRLQLEDRDNANDIITSNAAANPTNP
jgi:regulator of protease activity HflC (stomatin/prohibitin superfamily)